MAHGPALAARLRAAGVEPEASPLDAWRRLRAREGVHATVLDLYELAAGPRGLQAHDLPLEERKALARAALPIVWPGFKVTEGSERRGEPIEIIEYDADWPRKYERWRKRLQRKLGEVAQRIEHVGSTSVPGLTAKPIIDIQISVADLEDEARYVNALEREGVQLRSRDDLHRYFRPFPGKLREVHVHVCATGSTWERDHVLFRDYLRTNVQARDAYAAAKRHAFAVWADDRIAYTDAKSAAIRAILDAARMWAATNGVVSNDGGAHPG